MSWSVSGYYDYSENNRGRKGKYESIYEFVMEYVSRFGTREGAFRAAAEVFYPDKDPRVGTKRAWDGFIYVLRKRIQPGTGYPEHPEQNPEQDYITDNIEDNMGYYIENHSGPIQNKSKFVRDSKSNRRLFEFKKLLYVVLGEFIKPKSRLTSYIEEYTRDPRVLEILRNLGENVWYNGKKYVKLPKRAAALLYIVSLKIYQTHHGSGNKPTRLIKKFFEVSGYGPGDLEKELREIISLFIDWLLFV